MEHTKIVNIHLVKTLIAKVFKVKFNQIKFTKYKDIQDRVLNDTFVNQRLIRIESFMGAKLSDANFSFEVFDEMVRNIVDDGSLFMEGQSIQEYIDEVSLNIDKFSFLIIVNQTKGIVHNVEIVMTKNFYKLISSELKNTELSLGFIDRNLVNLNYSYFGSIKDVSTLN